MIKGEFQSSGGKEWGEEGVCCREKTTVDVDYDGVQAEFEVFGDEDGGFDLVV